MSFLLFVFAAFLVDVDASFLVVFDSHDDIVHELNRVDGFNMLRKLEIMQLLIIEFNTVILFKLLGNG